MPRLGQGASSACGGARREVWEEGADEAKRAQSTPIGVPLIVVLGCFEGALGDDTRQVTSEEVEVDCGL